MELTASDDDVDELGHVSNIRYVRWLQDVATAHSAAVGFDVADYRALDGVFVVRRHEIDYLSPAFRGDRLRLDTWVESWKQASSVRRTDIVRVTGDGRDPGACTTLARGTTLWAFVGVSDGRIRRIPETVRLAFLSQPRRERSPE